MTDFTNSPATNTPAAEHEAQFGDYFALLKPRVMQLVVFTAIVGMLAAPVGVHPVIGFASILFVAIGAGASGALNMWWDADIDSVMRPYCEPANSIRQGATGRSFGARCRPFRSVRDDAGA